MKTKSPHFYRNAAAFFVLLFILTTSLFTQPQYYNNQGTSNGNAFPFSVAAGKVIQWIYLPGEFAQPTPAPSGNITKIYFMCATASITFTNLTVKMGRSNLTSLPTGAFYTGQLDTVYFNPSVTLNSTAGQWMSITLNTPFMYYADSSLIIEVNQCTASATGMTIYNVLLTGNRRTYNQTAGGCNYIYQGQGTQLANTGLDISPAGPPQNYALNLPTPGVNTNYVQIPFNAGMNGFPNVTIEAWVKVGGFTTANTILNKGAASFDYQLGINSTGIPFFRAQGVIATSTGFIVSAGVWTHIAATFDGSNVKFYKDGALTSTIPLAGSLGSSVNEMRIGRGNADPGSGNIEELRLWSVARTQGAIDSNKCRKYPSQFNNSTGLKALWHLDNDYLDSISGFNGTPLGTVGFDTVSFPIPGVNCNLVAIEPVGNIVPQVYSLSQNYPNPFNPQTSIRFSIPVGGFVEMKVFDLLGREVATLVQDPFTAGTYEVTFDASKLSSGVYFYTISSGDFKESKKMLLIK